MFCISWTLVELLITGDHRSAQILEDLKMELDRNGVCFNFVEVNGPSQRIFLASVILNPC